MQPKRNMTPQVYCRYERSRFMNIDMLLMSLINYLLLGDIKNIVTVNLKFVEPNFG